jgi:hypothetical protein
MKWAVTVFLFVRLCQMWGKVLMNRKDIEEQVVHMNDTVDHWTNATLWTWRLTGLFFTLAYFFVIWVLWRE